MTHSGMIMMEPSSMFGSAQAMPLRAISSMRSGDRPAVGQQHIDGDARKCRKNRTDDQRGDGDLDQRAEQAFEHPRPRRQKFSRPVSKPEYNLRVVNNSQNQPKDCREALLAVGGRLHAGRCRRVLSEPPVMRSMAERTASRALRSRTASSSGAAAPERRIRICGSGSMIGSSQCALHDEGQVEALLAAAADQRRRAFEVEIARRDRGRASRRTTEPPGRRDGSRRPSRRR